MNLRNLNISSQLKIGFGIIIFLFLFLSIVAWQMNNDLAKQTTELYDHPHTVRKAVGDMKADMLLIQREMKELSLTGGKENKSDILQNIEIYKGDINKQFTVLYDRYLGPRADIDSAVINFTRYNTIREETVRLLNEGKIEEVKSRTKFSGTGGQHAELMLRNIDTIDKFSSNKSAEFYNRAVELNRNLKIQLLIAVAGLLALIMLITHLISRSIQLPLAELTKTTKKFKEGIRDARSSYISRNEFGILSGAFNQMADKIETELTLSNHAAKVARVMLSEDDATLCC